jgi:hypothetical protein
VSIFDNINVLRLSMDAAATASTREILMHAPGRKLNRADFFRVHPDDMALANGVFIDTQECGSFFVIPSMNAKRVVFLWLVPVPDWMVAEIDGDQGRADNSNSLTKSVSEHIGVRREARR